MLVLGFALGAFAAWAFQSNYRQSHKTDDVGHESYDTASPPTGGFRNSQLKQSVHALGTLEPQGGSILVTSPLVGTPIKDVLVREGQLVTAGQRSEEHTSELQSL